MIPKSTIHRFTQELASDMLETKLNTQFWLQEPVILADETEERAIKAGEHNQLRVALSIGDGSKPLLSLAANEPHPTMPTGSILISDGEPALKDQNTKRNQLCVLRAMKRLMYAIWRECAAKEEREYLKAELEEQKRRDSCVSEARVLANRRNALVNWAQRKQEGSPQNRPQHS